MYETQSETEAAPGWTIDDVRGAAAKALGHATWGLPDDADLFEHGLDSLRMMRLAGALRAGGYDLPLRVLAETPTVAAWFEIISESGEQR
ncbi:phosphopantetheine-binding protein [Nocardia sp. NBC_00565]|uniref:phosphopantetheine-binding protein n=1 Tax=Nocardia sp. NBC_00565 TaxID=2975993 RepID=UPI002E7FBA54|nr:phosphopantetheine-binding protein [Nocardia sp. NBC_00565]WUC02828.1 phosphopantetheine-binding protein [Nocardia sp. NBC_00565]